MIFYKTPDSCHRCSVETLTPRSFAAVRIGCASSAARTVARKRSRSDSAAARPEVSSSGHRAIASWSAGNAAATCERWAMRGMAHQSPSTSTPSRTPQPLRQRSQSGTPVPSHDTEAPHFITLSAGRLRYRTAAPHDPSVCPGRRTNPLEARRRVVVFMGSILYPSMGTVNAVVVDFFHLPIRKAFA